MYRVPIHFQAIRVRLPEREIFARLGFRKGLTSLSAAERETVSKTIEEASDLVLLKGAALVMDIRDRDDAGITLEGGTVFPSSSLTGMLAGCSGALLMGATAGQGIMDAIAACSSQNLTRAVILDAVGSEMADAALDWIMDYAGQDLLRSSRRLTRKRFSAGYGDFSLENQQTMFDMLQLGEIGIRMTPAKVLIPEKSVTAVAGVLRLT